MSYVADPFRPERRATRVVRVGSVAVGGDHEVLVGSVGAGRSGPAVIARRRESPPIVGVGLRNHRHRLPQRRSSSTARTEIRPRPRFGSRSAGPRAPRFGRHLVLADASKRLEGRDRSRDSHDDRDRLFQANASVDAGGLAGRYDISSEIKLILNRSESDRCTVARDREGKRAQSVAFSARLFDDGPHQPWEPPLTIECPLLRLSPAIP